MGLSSLPFSAEGVLTIAVALNALVFVQTVRIQSKEKYINFIAKNVLLAENAKMCV